MGAFLEDWLQDMGRARLIQEEQDRLLRERRELGADRELLENAREARAELEETKESLAAREKEVEELRSTASGSAKKIRDLESEVGQARKALAEKDLELGQMKAKNEDLSQKKVDLQSDKRSLEEENEKLKQEFENSKEESRLALQQMKKGAAMKLYDGYWGTIRVLRKRYPGINLGDVDAIFDEIAELSPEPEPVENEGEEEDEGAGSEGEGEVQMDLGDDDLLADPSAGDLGLGGDAAGGPADMTNVGLPSSSPLAALPEAFLALSEGGASRDEDPELEVLGSFPAPAASGTNENPP